MVNTNYRSPSPPANQPKPAEKSSPPRNNTPSAPPPSGGSQPKNAPAPNKPKTDTFESSKSLFSGSGGDSSKAVHNNSNSGKNHSPAPAPSPEKSFQPNNNSQKHSVPGGTNGNQGKNTPAHNNANPDNAGSGKSPFTGASQGSSKAYYGGGRNNNNYGGYASQSTPQAPSTPPAPPPAAESYSPTPTPAASYSNTTPTPADGSSGASPTPAVSYPSATPAPTGGAPNSTPAPAGSTSGGAPTPQPDTSNGSTYSSQPSSGGSLQLFGGSQSGENNINFANNSGGDLYVYAQKNLQPGEQNPGGTVFKVPAGGMTVNALDNTGLRFQALNSSQLTSQQLTQIGQSGYATGVTAPAETGTLYETEYNPAAHYSTSDISPLDGANVPLSMSGNGGRTQTISQQVLDGAPVHNADGTVPGVGPSVNPNDNSAGNPALRDYYAATSIAPDGSRQFYYNSSNGGDADKALVSYYGSAGQVYSTVSFG